MANSDDGLAEDAPELRLSDLLDQYRELREERMKGESRRKQAADGLLICGLQQRLLSSIEAFARTLRVHRKTVEKQWAAPSVPRAIPLDLSAPDADDDRTELNPEELERDDDLRIEAVSTASAGVNRDELLYGRERVLLDRMTELAESSRHLPDARIKE